VRTLSDCASLRESSSPMTSTLQNVTSLASRVMRASDADSTRHCSMEMPMEQGLYTLVHLSAQLEPCLTPKNTLHTLNTPQHPLNTGYATPTRTPCPIQSAEVELRSERV